MKQQKKTTEWNSTHENIYMALHITSLLECCLDFKVRKFISFTA